MRYPKPVRRNGKWEVDLRAWGFGWHHVLGDQAMPDLDAVHAAYAKLAELRAARVAEPRAQMELVTGAPGNFATVVDRWEAGKRVRKEASKRYVKTYAARLRRDFGPWALSDFVDGHGQERLTAYQDRIIAAGDAARTVRNVMTTLKQALRYCANPERRWLPFVPEFPARPGLPAPLYQWIDEPIFRLVRARLYTGDLELKSLQQWLARPGNERQRPAEHFIARRRVHVSWLFYTGVRAADAGNLTADDVGLDVGVYIRRAQKTGAVPLQFPMPEPLIDDLREYLAIVGREFFLPREPIGGGRFANLPRLLQRTARAHGIHGVDVTPRIFRRSFARQMFLLGYEPLEVAELMGHVDLRMLQEIYAQVPRAVGAGRSLWKRSVARAPQGSGAPARVLSIVGGTAPAKGEGS